MPLIIWCIYAHAIIFVNVDTSSPFQSFLNRASSPSSRLPCCVLLRVALETEGVWTARRVPRGRKCEPHRGCLISSDSETASSAVRIQQSRHSLDSERDELTSRDEAPHASSRGMDVEDAEVAEAALDPRIQVPSSQMTRSTVLQFRMGVSAHLVRLPRV